MQTPDTTPQQQPPALRRAYDFLSEKGKIKPGRTFEEWEERMQDPEKLKSVYNFLNENGKIRPGRTYEDWSGRILKKKEHSLPMGIPLAPEETQHSLEALGSKDSSPVLESGLTEEEDKRRSLEELSKAPTANGPSWRDALPKNLTDPFARSAMAPMPEQNIQAPEIKGNGIDPASSAAGSFNEMVVDAAASLPKTLGIISHQAERLFNSAVGLPEPSMDNNFMYKAGQWIQDKALDVGITATNPKYQDSFFLHDVPAAFGSVFSIIASQGRSLAGGKAGQLLQGLSKEGPVKAAAQQLGNTLTSRPMVTGGMMMGVNEYDQAIASGADDQTAFGVFLKNYQLGMTEAVPIQRALARINKASGGKILQVLKNGTVGSIEEAAQEGIQTVLSNWIAKGTYDPERAPFRDMLRSMGAGAFVGFLLPGIGAAMQNMTPEQRKKTQEVLNEEFKAMKQEAALDTPNTQQANATAPSDQTLPGSSDNNAGQQVNDNQDQPVSTAGPGQDLDALKRSEQAVPVQEQQPSNIEAQVDETNDSGTTAGSPVSSPTEQRTDITAEEGRDILKVEEQIPDSGDVDQTSDHPAEISDITDPEELASLYMEEVSNPSVAQSDVAIASVLSNSKVKRDSFINNDDAVNITPGMAKSYFSSKGLPLDVVAKEASEILNPFGDGTGISPADVADFMKRYKSGASTLTTPSGNTRLAEIANQYAAVTGKTINKKAAASILEKAAKRAKKAESRAVFSAGFMEIAEQAERGTIDFSDAKTRAELIAVFGLSNEEYVFLTDFYGQQEKGTDQQATDESVDENRNSPVSDAQNQATALREGAEVPQRPGRTPESGQEALVREIQSRPLTHVHGLNMGSGVAKGTYLSTETSNRYSTPETQVSSAEVDISNPRLLTEEDDIIYLRNNILRDNLDKFELTDFVALERPDIFDVTIDFLSDSGVDRLAEMVTDHLIAQGYDSIYFRESDTQEGELVVFDRSKVRFKTQPDNQVAALTAERDAKIKKAGKPDVKLDLIPAKDLANYEPVPGDPQIAEEVEQGDQSQAEGEIPIGTEVEFDWHDGRRLTGKVEKYQHGRVHVRTDAGTSYPLAPHNVNRIGVTAKKAAPKDADKTVAYNSRRSKPIGIVGSPDSGFMFMTDLGDNIKKQFEKWMTSKGWLPRYVFDRMVKMNAEISKFEAQIRFTVSDFKKAIKKEYDGKLTDDQITDLNLYLQGKAPSNPIPPATMDQLDIMRAQIDNLSMRFINEGIISGDLQATFTKNLGTYLTRSYRKFDDPFWAEFVPAEVRSKAEAFIRDNAATKGQTITDEEVQGLINYLLYEPNAPMAMLSGSRLGAKDLSLLKKRGDIAPEIRALYGEYSDPILNYSRSITKMATMIAKHHFLTDVRANGLGKFLFEKPTGKYSVKLAAKGSKTMAPLNGLYTTKEIADAFADYDKQVDTHPIVGFLMRAISWVKLNKTVYSIQTHVRNVVGNGGLFVMNGHWRFNKAGVAVQTAWADIYGATDQAVRDRFLRYAELGIIKDSAAGGELRALIKDIRGGDDFFSRMGEYSFKKTTRKVTDFAKDAYQAEDDMFKIFAFENELARYKKAYPNMPQTEVEELAAEIVRTTMPTWSRIPKGIKMLRAQPFVGSFVSFPAEIFRTTYNTLVLATKEMSNPATRDIGVQRTVGIMLAMSIPTIASYYTMYALGMDREDDEDFRKFAAPWQKDSEFLYLNREGDKYSIVDMGYSDPHNYVKRPFYAFLNGDDLTDSGLNAMKSMARPFVDENLLMERIYDLMRNQNDQSDRIYNPDAPLGDQLSTMYAHLWPITEPGTIGSIRRIVKGVRGESNKYGKEYSATGEILSVVTGQKEETKDIAQALLYRAYELKDRIEATDKDYFRVIKNQEATPEQKASAERVRQEATENILTDAKDIYLSAIRLGVDPKTARKYMILTRNANIYRATARAK